MIPDTLNYLRDLLPPGTLVATILRHRSRSGLSQSISLVIAKGDQLICLDHMCQEIGIGKIDRIHGGIKIAGWGMDMGFELVYCLGRKLYPVSDTGRRARSPRHAAQLIRAGHTFQGNASGWDTDGGYALNQYWI